MLMSATIFEGYDITIFHLATPEISRTFHLDDPAIGLMATIVRFGGMLSFFVVILAVTLLLFWSAKYWVYYAGETK